ncbi:MAG: hypothetical protein FWD78_08915 [Treponema sp.]|nr:hypothetical protein [Treponema sp.]
MSGQMTVKERAKAAMEMKPVDRLPFWPKLDEAFRKKWGKPVPQFHDYIGSDRVIGINQVFREVHKNTSVEIKNNGNKKETLFITKSGTLKQKNQFDEASQAWHPMEFPIKTKTDIEIMTEWYRDIEVQYDKDLYEKALAVCKDAGNNALVNCSIGESSLMYFVEWLAGVEQAHYLLQDYTEETEELFAQIHKNLLKKMEISAEHSPADSFLMVENTSTTLISPTQYEKYCFPQISQYGEIAKSRGRLIMVHMCGHLKLLLPQLNKLPVNAFEAFTPPSVGNTTLADGRKACPDKCLIGGTNAVVWLGDAQSIINYMEEALAALPHHRGIYLSSAGVMPPRCEPQTIKTVKDWIDGYKGIF